MNIEEARKRLEKLYISCTSITIQIDALNTRQNNIIEGIKHLKLDIEQEEDKRIIEGSKAWDRDNPL